MHLQGKVAIVYGGGGAIGGAVARTMARDGAYVVVAGRTRAKLDRVVDDIVGNGGRAEADALDVMDEQAVRSHADDVAARMGGIDITFNAVGIMHVQGLPFAELSLEQFMHPLSHYLRANFIVAHAVAPHLAKRGGGVLLTLCAVGSQKAGIGYIGYGVTCGAIETFSRMLSGELGRSGTRVICLRPDVIPETLATSHVRDVFERVAERTGVSVEAMLQARVSAETPLGRFPKLHEIAEYAAFVASDRGGAMTASIANLSCGWVVD